MFGFIIFILVLSFVGRLFTRPFFGYYRPFGGYYRPYGGFGGWGHHYGPMCHGHHHHHHHHHGYRW